MCFGFGSAILPAGKLVFYIVISRTCTTSLRPSTSNLRCMIHTSDHDDVEFLIDLRPFRLVIHSSGAIPYLNIPFYLLSVLILFTSWTSTYIRSEREKFGIYPRYIVYYDYPLANRIPYRLKYPEIANTSLKRFFLFLFFFSYSSLFLHFLFLMNAPQ